MASNPPNRSGSSSGDGSMINLMNTSTTTSSQKTPGLLSRALNTDREKYGRSVLASVSSDVSTGGPNENPRQLDFARTARVPSFSGIRKDVADSGPLNSLEALFPPSTDDSSELRDKGTTPKPNRSSPRSLLPETLTYSPMSTSPSHSNSSSPKLVPSRSLEIGRQTGRSQLRTDSVNDASPSPDRPSDRVVLTTQSAAPYYRVLDQVRPSSPASPGLVSPLAPSGPALPPRNYNLHQWLWEPAQFLSLVESVVKNRSGTVLSREMVIKSDHFVAGAPNFRPTELRIFGSAQPTTGGVATCGEGLPQVHEDLEIEKPTCFWLSTREEPLVYLNGKPFCLRSSQSPLVNLSTFSGISSARLEHLELRLKADILREAQLRGGVVLAHDEVEPGKVVPSWIAASEVKTPREVFDGFREQGWRVKYVRVPMSPEKAPGDDTLDGYISALKDARLEDPIMFNCGVGAGRTTFSMVVALLIRRQQVMSVGLPDPFSIRTNFNQPAHTGIFGTSTPALPTAVQRDPLVDMEGSEISARAVLRLVSVLETALRGRMDRGSALESALSRPGPLLSNLRAAVLGQYHPILQLASVLEHGSASKRALDSIIDRCDMIVNLREVVLVHRVRYAVDGDAEELEDAVGCFQRYFYLLAFAGYVAECFGGRQQDSKNWEWIATFSQWMKGRTGEDSVYSRDYQEEKQSKSPAISISPRGGSFYSYSLFTGRGGEVIEGAANFRKIGGMSLYGVAQPTIKGMKNVIEKILKTDNPTHPTQPTSVVWINLREEPLAYVNSVPYVLRDQYFTIRNIRSYAGINPQRLENIEEKLKEDVLKEVYTYEGRVLLHGETPEGTISAHWEDVRDDDVLTPREVATRLQQEEGCPISYYRVPVTAENPPEIGDFEMILRLIATSDLREVAFVLNCQVGLGRSTTGTVMASLVIHWLNGTKPVPSATQASHHSYPIIHSLLRVIRNGLEIKQVVDDAIDTCAQFVNLRDTINQWRVKAETETEAIPKRRAVRRGVIHLRRYFVLIIFQAYLNEQEPTLLDELEPFSAWVDRHKELKTMHHELLQAESVTVITPVDHLKPGDGVALTTEVVQVVNSRCGQVLGPQTIVKADLFPGAQKLTLPERIDGAPNYRRVDLAMARSQALQVIQGVVFPPASAAAKGIVAPGAVKLESNSVPATPTKKDSGLLQPRKTPRRSSTRRQSYDMQVPGTDNIKLPTVTLRVATLSSPNSIPTSPSTPPYLSHSPKPLWTLVNPTLFGTAMPTREGIRRIARKCDADQNGSRWLLWTSMREEPVIYIPFKDDLRPFVLRDWRDATRNLETTGIAKERVEMMEERMKGDLIQEIKKYGGRILLHDEEVKPSGFEIVVCLLESVFDAYITFIDAPVVQPVWETVCEEDILTPLELFQSVVAEGYKIDYLRVPITDEQAPIPDVFDILLDRLMKRRHNADPIFNCQMGRGRTTTGMITAVLMEMIVGNEHLVMDINPPTEPATDANHSESELARRRYVNGEYRIVMQLIAVLPYGRIAKQLTDRAVDLCDHMQNLRTAIYDFKVKLGAMEMRSKKWEATMEVGLNYLIRYFFLVCFAGYLLEEWAILDDLPDSNGSDHNTVGSDQLLAPLQHDTSDSSTSSATASRIGGTGSAPAATLDTVSSQGAGEVGTRERVAFSTWLKDRKEITNLVKAQNQSFD
ncbi:hypothetical protein HDU93_004652 [Gonapodya sp. JEL0774]|nr:hypothetical protein HDU93_004652 [Gonapodya sp. JEL0774]